MDYYLSAGHADAGERIWEADEVPEMAAPFTPISLRLKDMRGNIVDTLRSTEPAAIEFEYQLSVPTTGLRVGFYLSTMRGDYVLTSFFDLMNPKSLRSSACGKPDDMSAAVPFPPTCSTKAVIRWELTPALLQSAAIFSTKNASAFNVDVSGVPGTHWPEARFAPIRPRLDWKIEKMD